MISMMMSCRAFWGFRKLCEAFLCCLYLGNRCLNLSVLGCFMVFGYSCVWQGMESYSSLGRGSSETRGLRDFSREGAPDLKMKFFPACVGRRGVVLVPPFFPQGSFAFVRISC